jgi:maltodextrin utilization protein YvdJ
MGSQKFLIDYLQACASGKLPLSECSSFWQFGIIGVFLFAAVLLLIVLRFYY